MKKILLFCSSLFAFSPIAQTQSNVQLHISPRLGNAPFALNTPVSAGTYEYKVTRLEYYISEIKITHDGGQETPVADLYLLVRPAEDSVYDLGSRPNITHVESITFSVGVDEAHNHLDPSTYPGHHPLGPQDPSMHWGWAAGYRFAALEGVAGNNFVNTFEIHALGDANYKTLTLATIAENTPAGKVIHLVADYAQMLHLLDVSGGMVAHGSTGHAVTLMNNMKNLVFSAATSVTAAPSFEGAFRISPNPAPVGNTIATMTLPAGFDYRLSATDLTGRVVLNLPVAADTQSFSFGNSLNAGVYFVHLWQDGHPVAVEKLIVTH